MDINIKLPDKYNLDNILYNKFNLSDIGTTNIIFVYDNEKYEIIPREKIKEFYMETDESFIVDFKLVLTLSNNEDLIKYSEIKENILGLIFSNTETEEDFNDLKLTIDLNEYFYFNNFKNKEYPYNNLLVNSILNIKDKEITFKYEYEESNPEFDILNQGTGKKLIYTKEDISDYLEGAEDITLEMLNGVQFENNIISITDTGDYYILSLTDINSRLTTSALFEKDE
jgi:hypothetical protein